MQQEKYKALYSPSGSVSIVPENVNFKDSIEPGFYMVQETDMGMGTMREMYIDESIKVPLGAINLAKDHVDISYIHQYFSDVSTDIHKKLQLKLKLGYLLHGIQGTGKTTSCYAVAEQLIKSHGAVVITVTDIKGYIFALNFLEKCKQSIGDFMSVTIFDECEDYMYDNANEMKRRLDSSGSLNNHLSFFTTNHINMIPEAIKNRPSRIKFVTEITGIKDEAIIFEIISRMNQPLDSDIQLTQDELKKITLELVNNTLDEIKNTFIDTVFEIQFAKRVTGKSVTAQLAKQALES